MKTKSKWKYASLSAIVACALLGAVHAGAATITGDPLTDGWVSGGNSLENGVYVRGNANYGFEVYSNSSSIGAGSNLLIADGANSWLLGDTVLGLGGSFESINALAANWPAFSGGPVNQFLGGATGPKLQAKFSANGGAFTPSTIAPGAGNGAGSLGTAGLGAVQIRTSGYNDATIWAAGSGLLNTLASSSHISRNGVAAPDTDVARISWIWDANIQQVTSWEILLNVSLLDRLDVANSLTPGRIGTGGTGLLTVQNGDNDYTDGMVQFTTASSAVVPLPDPASLSLLGIALVGLMKRARGKKASA